jgi:hypothetical protein
MDESVGGFSFVDDQIDVSPFTEIVAHFRWHVLRPESADSLATAKKDRGGE